MLGYQRKNLTLRTAGAFSLPPKESRLMKIAIWVGQQVSAGRRSTFLARSDSVAGVFYAPEKPGARPNVLKGCSGAEGKGVRYSSFLAPVARAKRCTEETRR
jgi:hypothetical protein